MMAFSALLVSLKVALPPSADPVPAPAINTMLAPAIPNRPKMVVAANLYIAASIWLLGKFLSWESPIRSAEFKQLNTGRIELRWLLSHSGVDPAVSASLVAWKH